MRKVLVAAAVAAIFVFGAMDALAATTTTVTASPKIGAGGQKVTFTATFTLASGCTGTIQPHYFTIDGKKYTGKLAVNGKNGTETYSTSSLSVGTHTVSYYWQTSNGACIGGASIAGGFVVKKAVPSPTPRPSPSPSPSPSAAPSPVPSAAPSPTPVALVSSQVDDSPAAYVGVALIVVSVLAGAGLVIFGRR